MTKTFFREQLFKGLRQNILKNNSWGSYNVLPCIDNPSTGVDDTDLQKCIDNGRSVYRTNDEFRDFFNISASNFQRIVNQIYGIVQNRYNGKHINIE